MSTQTTNKTKSRSERELEPYNNWHNRLIAATMMNNAKPETIGGFLLGNFLKPIVSEGMSRLSDGLMNALFPTKKTPTDEGDKGGFNRGAFENVADNYFSNKYPAFGSGTNSPQTYSFTPSLGADELAKKFLG